MGKITECTYTALMLAITLASTAAAQETQVRVRDISISPGILEPGPKNAITDVAGVKVGHVTVVEGRSVRTGATAILPHGGNLYQDKVPAAIFVANGFGKLMGLSQVRELGEIETPIVLTNTLAVPRAADAILDWTLGMAGNEAVRSVNAVVGETNDARLNDIRDRTLTPATILKAITSAQGGSVAEGNVGAGTGTVAFGFKGGIGTSSRALPESLGGYTVGVLVQSNYGGALMMDGVRIGEKLGQYYLKRHVDNASADGSIMIVVATNAPLSARNLERLAKRAVAGLARTGASMTNGSGDYVIAFSTHEGVRRTAERRAGIHAYPELANGKMSPLFQAAVEATEEAIYNSLLMAETMESYDEINDRPVRVEALPIDKVKALLEARYD